jgi:hypothetical protein
LDCGAFPPLLFLAFFRAITRTKKKTRAAEKRRSPKLLRSLRRSSEVRPYVFPDGDGDCNCTTWIERLGVPLLTGRMDEFAAVAGVALQVRRRFGVCV